MSSEPTTVPSVSIAGPAGTAGGLTPPQAKRIPADRTFHGDTVTDYYAWLADPQDPETTAFLRAQNTFTESVTAGQAGLRNTIFGEIKSRTRETDLSVPARKGDWWYYTRTVEGRQYAVYCRRAVRPDDTGPPFNADGSPLDGEEILIDGNEMAAGQEFFSLGAYSVSPDGRMLAYSTDFSGDERFTMHIRDLATGQTLPDEIPGTHYGAAWSLDATLLYYVIVDDACRAYQVWRHTAGTPADQDVLIFAEPDERFWVHVALTRSERYLVISANSKVTSEAWLIDAARPGEPMQLVALRRQGIEYGVEHQVCEDGGERLLILHNDGAENFELASAPLSEPASWTPLVRHRDDTRLLDVDAFATHLVLSLRRNGLTGLRIIRNDGTEHDVGFDEPVYTVYPAQNPDYRARSFRLSYVSLVTPDSVYDCDTATGVLTLLRRRPVLGPDGSGEYDPAQYEQFREWATAPDGTQVPISVARRRGTPRDGTAPLVLYGYGSYEISADPTFSIARLSLFDRGFVFAVAHVRGGGELGRRWYEDGKMLTKVNTFTDFIACARHLAGTGWTRPDRLVARSGSAGGLLVGAAVNMAPGTFGGIVAEVPFVDALTTVLDPARPLTVTEWEEWGDPLHDPAVYAYMKSYSPYENIGSATYPPILAVTSLNDTRVQYSEPAKWIARLQAEAAGGPFLLKTEMIAGHGGRSGRYDAWREEAEVLAWIIGTAGAG